MKILATVILIIFTQSCGEKDSQDIDKDGGGNGDDQDGCLEGGPTRYDFSFSEIEEDLIEITVNSSSWDGCGNDLGSGISKYFAKQITEKVDYSTGSSLCSKMTYSSLAWKLIDKYFFGFSNGTGQPVLLDYSHIEADENFLLRLLPLLDPDYLNNTYYTDNPLFDNESATVLYTHAVKVNSTQVKIFNILAEEEQSIICISSGVRI